MRGEYWDSQVYAGRLFLFGSGGDVLTISWDSLVRSLPVAAAAKLALFCGFLRSDYLYGAELQEMLHDPEIRAVIVRKFNLLDGSIDLTPQRLHAHRLGQQDNPCPFPHTDSEIYYHNLYVSGPSGVVRATATGRTKNPLSTRPQKIWDAPVVALAASWRRLAMAAGDEGLFELDAGQGSWHDVWFDSPGEPTRVTARPCQDCSWVFHSVFASAHDGGFLAAYEKYRDANHEVRRRLGTVVEASDLFQNAGYSWGVQDKLCSAVPDGISVIKYHPWKGDPDSPFTPLGVVRTAPWKGEIVSASAAPFGVVVELDHAVIVFPSSGEAFTLPGEPVTWRVFPRSKHYENQLHVIYDDRLEILSFNHDYLVDQDDKILGVSVFQNAPRGRRRLFE